MKFVISILTTQIPYPAKAQQQTSSIEFVPASPYFTGTYRDAVEIIYTQRIAVDNIASVIEDGKIEEAGFKAMQLSSQTRVAGKIVLDTYQEKISSTNNNNTLPKEICYIVGLMR